MRKTILAIFALSMLSSVAIGQSYSYRYWIDNNVAGAATGSATGEKAFEVDISSLSIGVHALHLQAVKDSKWSSVNTRYFVKTGQATATSARYWFDNNPATVHSSIATTGSIDLDISTLSVGLHAVHYQLLSNQGPSVVHTRYFMITGNPKVTSARYWFDNNPATMHSNVATTGSIDLDISSLPVGLHAVHYQLLSNVGPSAVRTRYFLINSIQEESYTAQISIDNGEVTTYEDICETIEIDIADLPAGTHQVHVTIFDAGQNIVYETTTEFVKEAEGEEPTEIEVTDISELSDAVYIEPVTALVGGEVEVNICLKNAQQATAYLFDLELPDGITVAKNANDKYIDALSDRHDDHMRSFNYKGDGVYAFSALSGNSEPLSGNDGAIRLVTLKIADDAEAKDYKIQIKNASYSLLNGTLVNLENTVSKITVKDYILGDANGNGSIDIGDAVTVVDFMVGKPTSNFIEAAADLNKNGEIDIADAVIIVNKVIGKAFDVSAPKLTETENIREPQ